MIDFIVTGMFAHEIYETSFCNALVNIGYTVKKINIGHFYERNLVSKIENHLSFSGYYSKKALYTLKQSIFKYKPKYCLIWRLTLITPNDLSVLKIASPETTFLSYNNDNPFGEKYKYGSLHQRRLWINFKKSIRHYDVNLVYRPSNIIQYACLGSKNTLLFPPSFIEERVPPFEEKKEFENEIVFVGHCTPKRLKFINTLINEGINVRIFGTLWTNGLVSEKYIYGEIQSVRGDAYYQLIANSKIVLSFLSELNEDVYTRRSFEIPACGSVMLSQRTPELLSCFEEGVEAEYFSDELELVEKAKSLLQDQQKIDRIRKAAYKKARTGGFEIKSRVANLIEQLEKINVFDDNTKCNI